ncbi:type II toxin-antitoxin system death-on-curing family toxin [Methylocystis sp. MJC1]|uniref:type II toxin-antitoxin system death-on-curing family toxin n=1 Tax=Methylocystis sp. MJC1 TaxID=2654282 RepID=UPI001FEE51CB|nr:type II toxin-antitoxin system death-on-curing family toxin [Methylocystis sp. MJC1]UZX13707.1 type II toxin-antitoxin system death-on-curing family toxin [Methylocystis sp. MJC1]
MDRYGGAHGVLNDGAVDASLARPQNLLAYEEVRDVFKLAACYAYGFAKNHCFVDGNKRIAFASAAAFLLDNRFLLLPAPAVGPDLFVRLAAGQVTEAELATILCGNCVRLPE